MKKSALILILLLPAMSLIGPTDAKAQVPTHSVGAPEERGFWQYGVQTEPNAVVFTLRDKAGQVGTYKALFAVTSPDSRIHSIVKSVSGATEVEVSFPRDFGVRWMKGVYTWECTVGKKTVTQGSFEYCDTCPIPLLRADVPREASRGR